MGDAGKDDALQVRKHGVEGLTLKWRLVRQGGADLPRLDLGQDRQGLDPLAVIGDPVDQGMARPAKLLGGHVVGDG